MRTIIQITAQIEDRFFALCDDGTVWCNDTRGDWYKMNPIPQDEDETTKN